MNSGIISKAISNIVEAQSEKKSEGFTMVNVRPGEKVSAMLDVLAHLYQKSPSVVIADALSRKIAAHAASSEMYADAILDAAEQVVLENGILHKESALGILEEQGLINIRDRYSRTFNF
jgi:predicted transcriptional regulator